MNVGADILNKMSVNQMQQNYRKKNLEHLEHTHTHTHTHI